MSEKNSLIDIKEDIGLSLKRSKQPNMSRFGIFTNFFNRKIQPHERLNLQWFIWYFMLFSVIYMPGFNYITSDPTRISNFIQFIEKSTICFDFYIQFSVLIIKITVIAAFLFILVLPFWMVRFLYVKLRNIATQISIDESNKTLPVESDKLMRKKLSTKELHDFISKQPDHIQKLLRTYI